MATYGKTDIERILGDPSHRAELFGDDVIRDGDCDYQIKDILDSLRELGYERDTFLNLSDHKKRKVARESRRLLRQRRRAEHSRQTQQLREDILSQLTAKPHETTRFGSFRDTIFSAVGDQGPGGVRSAQADVPPINIEQWSEDGKQMKLHVPGQGNVRADIINNFHDHCPACNQIRRFTGGGAKSRFVPVQICPACGAREALEGFFWQDRINVEVKDRDLHIDLSGGHPDAIPVTIDLGPADQVHAAKVHMVAAKIQRWIEAGNFRLERPQSSSLHHLATYSREHGQGRFYHALEPGGGLENLQDFVIDHNWGAAFVNAKDFHGGEFRLPYVHCMFEFRVSGIRVMVLYRDDDGAISVTSLIFGLDNIWVVCPYTYEVAPSDDGNRLLLSSVLHPEARDVVLNPEKCLPLFELLHEQVRACAIMLDAQVAVAEVVRAPERLNDKRERMGRTRLRDYHIVKLNRRVRAAPLPDDLHGGDSDRRSPRLHFRRGHWRHYDKHRTWIAWQLVGDPDLGFVEKEYRL